MSRLSIFLISALLFAAGASAQTLPAGVTQEQMDAALRDLSAVYGSPVTRTDQAKAICNQEQYVVECAKIGKERGLFPKERAVQVDALLNQLKGDVVEKMKQCGSVECLVGVATSVARRLSADNPGLARTVELTAEKVEEKRAIVDIAKSAGVAIEECQTMDPDTAPLDLLRACAKLAKNEKMQKYIPQEERGRADKSDGTVALKEALLRGEISCGDGTIDGCSAFCLNPTLEARQSGGAEVPAVCRDIAARFFGDEGVRDLERARGNVQQTFEVVKERYYEPKDRERQERERERREGEGTSTPPRIVCPAVQQSPCPAGEYRQGSTNELGCYIESACIPFNTKTQPEPKEREGRFICPALPTTDSCQNGEEKVVSFISPECGTYYTCRPAIVERSGAKYPYSFASGKVALSFEEARVYCYESGQGGATARGDVGECQRAFGISPPPIPPEKQCAQYGSGWHSMDESGNCFSPSMTEYATQSGVVRACTEHPAYGCSNETTRPAEPLQQPLQQPAQQSSASGQKEQVWNSNGLRSWIRADADAARINSLKQACAGVRASGNVWMPGAGTASSADFGMPDPAKCTAASACTSEQYFNGTSCTGQSSTTWGSGGSEGVSGSCSAELSGLLGSGCHSMGNAWFDNAMLNYVMPGGSTVRSCASSPVAGCSGSGQSAGGDGCPAGQYRNGAGACVTSPPSCTSGQYWNGSACVTSSTSSGSGAMQRCFYPNATKSGQPTGYTVWCEADYVNCHEGSPSGAAISMDGVSLGAPSSCESGWSGGSGSSGSGSTGGSYTSCPSGQYWNGSACVTTSTTDCTSGQYWNGSACVSSSQTDYSSAQSGCTSAGGTWDSAANYCRMPSSSGSSCSSDQYWNGSACVTNSGSTGGSTGGSSTSCGSGQYWDSRTSSCQSMQAACAEAGGTWDSAANYCRMPSSSAQQKPLAFLCPSGHDWNGSYCTLTPVSGVEMYLANVLSAFRSLLDF